MTNAAKATSRFIHHRDSVSQKAGKGKANNQLGDTILRVLPSRYLLKNGPRYTTGAYPKLR